MRINNELKRHHEKSSDAITPLPEFEMKNLVEQCLEISDQAPLLVSQEKLRDGVNSAMRDLPNFQYKKIENSTATAIFVDAHSKNDTDVIHCSENNEKHTLLLA